MPSQQRRPVTEPASPTPENDLYGTDTTTRKTRRPGRGTTTAASVATAAEAWSATRTARENDRQARLQARLANDGT